MIDGPLVSTNVICWRQVDELLQASVAFQVRAMPCLPVQLAAIGASVKVMVTGPPQLSDAVAEQVLPGAVESPHCNCLSDGQVIEGAFVSMKVIC
jgi:hypothetical protein